MGFKITELWAYISIADDGDEGICAIRLGDTWMPLIMTDIARIISLRPHAEKIASDSKKKIKLVRFSQRTDVEEF